MTVPRIQKHQRIPPSYDWMQKMIPNWMHPVPVPVGITMQMAYGAWAHLGPGPTWAWARLGPGPIWAMGPFGPGPIWALGPFGPRPIWALSPFGPGPSWALAPFGPRAHLGPGHVLNRMRTRGWDSLKSGRYPTPPPYQMYAMIGIMANKGE